MNETPLNPDDIRLEFISDPEHDILACEVFLRDMYVCGLFVLEPRAASGDFIVHAEFFGELSELKGQMLLDDYIQLLALAKERYVKQLLDGPPPGGLGHGS